MKNIITTIVFLVLSIGCKAQSPIINIEDNNGDRIQGTYYRDTNNLLNPFVGTYIYTDGTATLEIVLQKKIMLYDGYVYKDALIGEYRYSKYGLQDNINTLPNLLNNHTSDSKYSIFANNILETGSIQCIDCAANEIRVMGSFRDKSTKNYASIILGLATVGGQPSLIANIVWRIRNYIPENGDPVPLPAKFSGGNYILIKQP